MKFYCLITFILSLLTANLSVANEDTTNRKDKLSALQIGLAIGYGKQQDPFITESDESFYAFLDISYYGNHGFFDNGDIGFYLNTTATSSFNLIATQQNDRNIFQPISPLTRGINISGVVNAPASLERGADYGFTTDVDPPTTEQQVVTTTIPERDASTMAGLEFIFERDWGIWHSQWLTDISSTHKGQEIWLSYSNEHAISKSIFSYSLSIIVKDKNYINYYYGISEAESNNQLPTYTGKDSSHWKAKLAYSYPINKKLALASFIIFEKYDEAIYQSPIVHKHSITTFFAGIYYCFF